MTEADKAYALAEGLIAKARALRARELRFDREDLRALETLPPEIADLDALGNLVLNNTAVSDLSPIAGLGALDKLHLDQTAVTDLSPVADLTKLTSLLLNGSPVLDLSPIKGLTRLKVLSFGGCPVSNLSHLAGLKQLEWLQLINTAVTDLSPISGLTALKTLLLEQTDILDLRPVLPLKKLAEDPIYVGLQFGNCAATLVDSRIREISKMSDDRQRARALFDYLQDWEPPVAYVSTPEADPLFPVAMDDNRLEVAASTPTEAERDERLKQALHERLREKSRDLCNKAGNQFVQLSARARAVDDLVRAEFDALDLLLLHLAVDDLRDLEAMGREDDESGAFTPEVMLALGDVLRLGPGLTLGHPDVDTLVERANRRRAGPEVPQDELAAQDAMSEAVAGDEAAIGDRLRTLEAMVAGSDGAEDREVQKGANRSVLWRIAVSAGISSNRVANNVAMAVLSAQIIAFVEASWPALHAAAATYGPAFYDWFVLSIGQAKDFAGLVDKMPRKRSSKRPPE